MEQVEIRSQHPVSVGTLNICRALHSRALSSKQPCPEARDYWKPCCNYAVVTT
jgi:hypothetical protein